MMAAQLKETTMDPGKRTLLQVKVAEKDKKDTDKSVERLMGNKPEARFEFIQEKAKPPGQSVAYADCSKRIGEVVQQLRTEFDLAP